MIISPLHVLVYAVAQAATGPAGADVAVAATFGDVAAGIWPKIIWFLLILAVIAGGLVLWSRRLQDPSGSGLQVVAQLPLVGRARLCLIQVHDREILIGVHPRGVCNLLALDQHASAEVASDHDFADHLAKIRGVRRERGRVAPLRRLAVVPLGYRQFLFLIEVRHRCLLLSANAENIELVDEMQQKLPAAAEPVMPDTLPNLYTSESLHVPVR